MAQEEYFKEIDRGRRFASNLIAAAGIFLCGAVLLVFGIIGDGIGVPVVLLIAPVILVSLGLIFLATSLIQRNTVTLYLSVLLLVSAAVSFVANLTPVTYGMLYPFYIAAPAIASFFTMLMSGELRFHIRIMLVFALPAVFFALFAAGIWSAGVLIPALIMYVGLLALYAALSVNSTSEE